MRLSPLLHPDLVVWDLRAKDSREVTERLVDVLLEVHPELDRRRMIDRLCEREQKSGTGLERGVAVPHATVEGMDRTVMVIARLAEPVDFNTLDGSLVRIVFLMLSPASAISIHIRLLARIVRLCSGEEFLKSMHEARDAGELFAVIAQEDARHV